MYCWGSTENGELGLGAPAIEQILLPEFNSFSLSWKVKQVALGLTHTLILTEEGKVYSCGNNEVGQLGHNKATKRPEHVDNLEEYVIEQVACGDQHSIALTSWGLVYAWGDNAFGQLGLNSLNSTVVRPKLIKTLAHKQIAQVACGSNHSLALTVDGSLFSWGLNTYGQLGLGHRESPITEPHQLTLITGLPIRMIACGGQNCAILTVAGFLLTWGSNKHGQLGTASDKLFSTCPEVVPNLATYSEPLKFVCLGEAHTAVLDSYGKLWTCGYGRYGQLGHNNTEDVMTPRPVMDLVGTRVSQVACGRGHTIVYVPSQGQLYAFGQGLSGQLGIKTPSNRSNPQVVIGPWKAPSGRCLLEPCIADTRTYYIRRIFGGGDGSIVTVSSERFTALDYCITCPFLQPMQIITDNINKMLNISQEDMIEEDIFSYAELAFESLECWNRSFYKEGSSKVDPAVEFADVQGWMDKLGRISKESLCDLLSHGLRTSLSAFPQRPLTVEVLRFLLMAPLWREFTDPKNLLHLHFPYANAVLTLPATFSVTFKLWLQSLPKDFMRLLITHFKKVVAYLITLQKKAIISQVDGISIASPKVERNVLLSALQFLNFLHKENKQSNFANKRFVSYSEFYIPEITEYVDIKKDYLKFLSKFNCNYTEQDYICFCEFAFLFDPQAKTLLLQVDAAKQMHDAGTDSNPLSMFFMPGVMNCLYFEVRRDHMVEDTITQLNLHPVQHLKRPLKVHFVGEEAEDAGGVRKEFFILLLRELLNPDYGMFQQFAETNFIWFCEDALEADHMFSLIGIVCGLAIYNFTIIYLPFPLALYKKLLHEAVNLDDMAEMDPTLARNLQQLLDYEGNDVEDTFCLNFTVTKNYFGEAKCVPLKENGENIPVTSENKKDYVEALLDWKLNKSIENQFKNFYHGFNRVCGGSILRLFQPIELMELVIGNEDYDWTELQRNTIYKGLYYPDHPTIEIFWDVFHSLNLEQKKKFLLFLTGTDRIPILGMKAVKMVIESTGDTNFLPVAHTCVPQLDLPIYSTKEKLKYKLIQAIQQSEGFGLV